MLNIYNYNNILHNKTITITSKLPVDTTQINFYNKNWFIRFSIAQLIKNHAHLGGTFEEIAETSFWFLASRKNNFIFINMQHTLVGLRAAVLAVKGTIRSYQKFAFINNDITSWGYTTEYANMAGEPSFIYQWVGGAITNIKKLWPMYWTKLETQPWSKLSRRQSFIKMSLIGYRFMHSIPKLVFFNTIKYSVNAAAEAHAMFVGSFGLLDVDAHSVDPAVYLPSNDDSGVTLSYYNSIFCKLILKEKYKMVKNFIARKKLLRSVREHKYVNLILQKHMRTRVLLELHHAQNKWLHPVVWNTLKYTRNLFSFKMFPNIWDKSIVHKIFKSFHQIKYSFFAGKGKYSKAVKEYEKKVYRFYKEYLKGLFTINSKNFKINSISKALFNKYIYARKLFYLNAIQAFKKFSLLYKELLFIYKWMFDLEVNWYGPSLISIFQKYRKFVKQAKKEIKKLKHNLMFYSNILNKIRLQNKNFIFMNKNKISLNDSFVNLSSFFKIEDTWGDQFMPTKYKVLKLPTKKIRTKQILFQNTKKKSNPKHTLFMRQYNYKYSSAIWKMRKRPWLPVKNPIYYVKEPHFFYTKKSLNKSNNFYNIKLLKKRTEVYLNNFLPSYFKAFSKKKIKFNEKFLFPNSLYNIMPKRYNVYSIYLASRFNQKLWFLLLQYKQNKWNKNIIKQLQKQFNLNVESLQYIVQVFFNKKRTNNNQFTIENIYKNYILPNLPLKGQAFYESRGELHYYLQQIKLMSLYMNMGSKTIVNILPTNLLIFFTTQNSIYHLTNFFAHNSIFQYKKNITSFTFLSNLNIYLKNVFALKTTYNYKKVYKNFSKANKFFSLLKTKKHLFTGFDRLVTKDQQLNYINYLFFPKVNTFIKAYSYLHSIKNTLPTKKAKKLILKPNQQKKTFYQMWLEKREKKQQGIQNILNKDISFYMANKKLFTTAINKNYLKKDSYFRFYSKKKMNFKETPSLINELLTWNSKNIKQQKKNKFIQTSHKFKRRRNFKYNKRLNSRFQDKSPYYIQQQRSFLRKKRQKYFRPLFSIKDRSDHYLESNLINILNLQKKITLQSFYFLLLRLLTKIKNKSQKEQISFFYSIFIFCCKIIQKKTFYSSNFVNFIYRLNVFFNKKLQIKVSNIFDKYIKKLKSFTFNLIDIDKPKTKTSFLFKYKYFIDPYIKFHLWPYNFQKYDTSTFISFFSKKSSFYFKHYNSQTRAKALQKTVEFFGKKFDRKALNKQTTLFLSQASRIDRQFYHIYGKEKYKTWFNQRLMLNPTVRLSARNLLQSVLYKYKNKLQNNKKKLKHRKILQEVLLRFQKLKHKRFLAVRKAIFNDFMDRVSSVDDYFVDKHITPELFMIRNYGTKIFLKKDWWRFFDSSHFILWLARKPWISWEVEYEVKSTLRWFNNNTVYFRFI